MFSIVEYGFTEIVMRIVKFGGSLLKNTVEEIINAKKYEGVKVSFEFYDIFICDFTAFILSNTSPLLMLQM